MTTWAEQQARIDALRARLRRDPEDLAVTLALWQALGAGPYDLRDGSELVRIFKPLVLRDRANATRFAAKYRDLADSTGEIPRKELFDSELVAALKDAHAQTSEESLAWLCGLIGGC